MRASTTIITEENPGAIELAAGAMKVPNDALLTESGGLLQAT